MGHTTAPDGLANRPRARAPGGTRLPLTGHPPGSSGAASRGAGRGAKPVSWWCLVLLDGVLGAGRPHAGRGSVCHRWVLPRIGHPPNTERGSLSAASGEIPSPTSPPRPDPGTSAPRRSQSAKQRPASRRMGGQSLGTAVAERARLELELCSPRAGPRHRGRRALSLAVGWNEVTGHRQPRPPDRPWT